MVVVTDGPWSMHVHSFMNKPSSSFIMLLIIWCVMSSFHVYKKLLKFFFCLFIVVKCISFWIKIMIRMLSFFEYFLSMLLFHALQIYST